MKKRLTRTAIQVSHIQNHLKEIITYERENKKSIFELKKEAEKEQIDILCGAYIKESQEQVLIVGGESRIQAILLMEILSVMESEECDCPNCRKRETDKKEQQANSELDMLLNAFLRGELK